MEVVEDLVFFDRAAAGDVISGPGEGDVGGIGDVDDEDEGRGDTRGEIERELPPEFAGIESDRRVVE